MANTADTAEALNRIADILENSSEISFLQTVAGQFTILVVGAVVGALVGALATYYMRRQLQKELDREKLKQRREQRELLVSLIGDEIVLRWNQLISRDLGRIFETFSEDKITQLSQTQFKESDLFIFQQCANDISLTTVIEDNALVSSIIYVHLLAKDFCDCQYIFRELNDEYQALKTQNGNGTTGDNMHKSEVIECKLEGTWQELKTKYQKIDSEMHKIYNFIEKDYEQHITSSDFIQKQQFDLLDTKEKVKKVFKKRFP